MMNINSTFPAGFLDGKKGVRVIGDVHGDPVFASVVEEGRANGWAIMSLGDLNDRGPASDDAIRVMIAAWRTGEIFIPGNHDWKYARYLIQRAQIDADILSGVEPDTKKAGVKVNEELQGTIDQVDTAHDSDALKAGFLEMVMNSPIWQRSGRYVFAHGGASGAMYRMDPWALGSDYKVDRDKKKLVARALYGQTDGTQTPTGHPTRRYDWADRLPEGSRVVIGHDYLSGAIVTRDVANNSKVIHLDTGAGKGGRLSWLDITNEELA